MRVNSEQLAQQQLDTIRTLKAIAVHLVKDSTNSLTDDTRRLLKHLAEWLDQRAERQTTRIGGSTKASVTRTRLFCLQLEKLLEQLEHTPEPSKQRWLCDECDELLAEQQQRYLYEDMIACLRELSNLSVERGVGRDAVMYNDMASRLETRLECGHIDLTDEKQRAKDEALCKEFMQKLEAMRP
ncbi:MAG: hypothetical protein WC314_06175 [Vulcanimicrobiota bacterium]